MSENPPADLPRTDRRLPFGDAMRRMAVLVYAALSVGLLGLALYSGLVLGRPLTSAYVVAPAIGAVWFGLRLLMLRAPKKE